MLSIILTINKHPINLLHSNLSTCHPFLFSVYRWRRKIYHQWIILPHQYLHLLVIYSFLLDRLFYSRCNQSKSLQEQSSWFFHWSSFKCLDPICRLYYLETRPGMSHLCILWAESQHIERYLCIVTLKLNMSEDLKNIDSLKFLF
jgi:hypothetical protein